MQKSKMAISITVGLSLMLLSGCTSDSPSDDASSTPSESQSETSEAVEVDEGMSDVEITLPAVFFEQTTDAEIAAAAEREGYSSFTINPDGSVTYLIPKDDLAEDIAQLKEGLNETIQELLNNKPDVFQSVSFNDELTEFEVVVDREAFEADFEAQFISFTLSIASGLFQIYSGIAESEQKGRVDFIDEADGKVFESSPWPVQD
jgi:hypothetical protein